VVPHRRSATFLRRVAEGGGSRTVAIALAANLVIAIAKLVAGLVSGSTGMLAESAHSFADSTNEVFLFIGLQRNRRPADAEHPLGHGRETFLWAFIATIASFLVGGCVSVAMAVRELEHRHPVTPGIAAWIVLAISFIADGISWRQSLLQARGQAKEYGVSTWRYLVRASDPVVRAVVVEDSAGLAGLALVALGLLLSDLLGSSVPDSIASLLIGLLLMATAFGVARPLMDLLIGRSIPAPQLAELRKILEQDPAIDEVLSFRATYLGPEEVVVAAKVHPASRLTADELARAMDELDHKIRLALPYVAEVYLDVTAHRATDGPLAG
jgi:cation diffusion facilitator family transporter